MKKNIFLFLLIVFLSGSIFSQVSADPNEEFYSDAVNWFQKGYVSRLPQLKPYPVNVIKQMLSLVIQNGEESEKEKAEYYYKKFFGRAFHVSSSAVYYGKIYSLEDTYKKEPERFDFSQQALGNVGFSTDYSFSDFLGIGFDTSLSGLSSYISDSEITPSIFSGSDFSVIEPLRFNAGDIDLLLDVSGNVTFGNKNIYSSFGYNKLSYGLFPDDDLILSSSNQILNGTFNYEGEKIQYAQVFGLLGATNNDCTKTNDYSFNKFFTFHSVNVPLFNGKLNISYFEGAVFGKSFNPSFVIPIPWVIVSMADGKTESVYAGTKIEVKPVQCFSWNTELMLNDLNVKPFIKLKWNDAALRTAFKTGFTYTPLDSIASLISVDYTLVTPYTYTFYDSQNEDYNYRSYTNFSNPIGTNLLPNSDRITMTLNFKPKNNLKISTFSSYARHGNQFEDLDYEDIKKLDGTAYSDTSLLHNTQNLDSAKEQTSFLMQDDIMYTMQAGINVEYIFTSKKSSEVSIDVGYTFEFIQNDGVSNPIYSGNCTELTEENAEKMLDSWKNKLHNSYNHYFRAGAKIFF